MSRVHRTPARLAAEAKRLRFYELLDGNEDLELWQLAERLGESEATLESWRQDRHRRGNKWRRGTA